MRAVKPVGHAAAIALLLASGAAMADTKLSADVGLNGGIATNPYGATATSTSSATLNGTFSPLLTVATPTGSFRLGGLVNHTEYAQRYRATTDYSVSASTGQQLSPLLSMNASASYSSQVRNGLFPIFDPLAPPNQDPNVPVPVDPSATASYAERTRSVSGNLGFSATLSPRDTLSVSARGARVMFPSNAAASRDYDSYGAGFSYMRMIGADTSIGAQFDLSRVDYQGGGFGGGTQYAPSAVFSTRLSPRLSFNASAGLTFSETDVLGGKVHERSFSGSVGLCHAGERAHFCLSGSRRVAPSSFAGTSNVTQLGANYSYQLSGRSTISASASYGRARSLGVGNVKTDYGQASLSYSRKILERLSGVVSVTYSDTYDSFVPRDANYYGTIGLRYRLGDT